METGKTFKFNGNKKNEGMIANLPQDCCAEGPIYADALGLHPVTVGSLPPQLAALNMTNINVQGLGVQAALTSDPEMVVQAAALDPLASSVCTLKEIREMVTEMLDAEARWLPNFKGKRPKAVPTISIPKDVVPADAPIDPALAIFARFGELSD